MFEEVLVPRYLLMVDILQFVVKFFLFVCRSGGASADSTTGGRGKAEGGAVTAAGDGGISLSRQVTFSTYFCGSVLHRIC
jgi:hypothetical protein